MNNLANTFKDALEFEKAEEQFEKILKINPKYLNGITNYANLKFQLDEYEKAINLYSQALKLDNKSNNIHYNIGLTYQSYGDFEKAEYHFKEMLRLDPNATIADRLISRFTQYDKDNNHFKDMLKRSDKIDKLSDKGKINLYFALGKAFEDTKDFAESFNFIKKANDLANSQFNYIEEAQDEFNNNLKTFFDEINENDFTKTDKEKRVIFILGLPRSGTSLAEQIISTHAEVYGAGESGYLENIIKDNFYINGKLNMDIINDKQFEPLIGKIGQKYINLLN